VALHCTGKDHPERFVESLNGRLRDECLNEHLFRGMAAARRIIAVGRIDYSEHRPHTSLRGLPRTTLQPGPDRTTKSTESSYERGLIGQRHTQWLRVRGIVANWLANPNCCAVGSGRRHGALPSGQFGPTADCPALVEKRKNDVCSKPRSLSSKDTDGFLKAVVRSGSPPSAWLAEGPAPSIGKLLTARAVI
jgi:hypothetical protein